jgi:glucokinase
VLLNHLKQIAAHGKDLASKAGLAPLALGIATAGWIDPHQGAVVHATGNLPGWMGTGIRAELETSTGLPVAVENDANALAIAERHFGLATNVDNFVCMTLGTGVGGGCYVGGHLNRGAHYLANALGHIQIQPGGLPCTCGQSGCLEAYANAAALVRYAGSPFETAEQVIAAANAGDTHARQAQRTYARYLALGCSAIVHLLDPQLIVISGGVAQNNPALIPDLTGELAKLVLGWEQRRLQVCYSPLGFNGGVIGAAALALEELPALSRRLEA